MTPRAFFIAHEGYEEKVKVSWEQARMISYYAVAPHIKSNKSMENLIPFGWDKSKIKSSTKEDFDILTLKAKEFHGI